MGVVECPEDNCSRICGVGEGRWGRDRDDGYEDPPAIVIILGWGWSPVNGDLSPLMLGMGCPPVVVMVRLGWHCGYR